MAEISVIVPVYKVEDYLCRCVDSVLGQSFGDFVLVLVDDGSPDSCPRICDEYAEKDPRVRVIHQENRGLSGARNAGIDWALAHTDCPWLTFLDSDDWVHPDYLRILRKAALQLQAPVSACSFAETRGETVEIPEGTLTPMLWNAKDFYIRERVTATVAWAKLYRRECFRTIRYPEGKIHEDEYVTYRILFEQKKLAYVPAPLHNYFRNEQGITKSMWTPRRMDVFMAYEQQIRYFRSCGNQQQADVCLHHYMRNAYGQMMELRHTEHPEAYSREEHEIRSRAKELLKECHRRDCLSFETDYCVLTEFYPVRTRIHMYYLAARRRLRKK